MVAQANADDFRTIATTLLDIARRTAHDGRLADAIRLLGHGIAVMDTTDARDCDLARVLVGYGQLLSLNNFQGQGDCDETLAILDRARSLAERSGDRQSQADAIDLLGTTRYYRALAGAGGTFDDATPYFEQALALRKEIGDTRGIAETIFHLGLVQQNTGRWEDARKCFERAVEAARSGNHQLEHSYAVRHLGFVCQHDGNLAGARRCLEESLTLREEIGFRLFLPFSLLALGDVCLQSGDIDTAESCFERALAIAEEIQSLSQTVFGLISRGEVAQVRGRHSQARLLFERAREMATAQGFTRGSALASRMLDAPGDPAEIAHATD